MKATLTLLALLAVSSGYFANESFAEISKNQAFLLEGSGFAVTEEIIKTSEIDLGISSQDQRGSTINFLTEDGFITLDDEEFVISNLEGKFLREGKYIRMNGEIESSSGFDSSISFFGRLVDESKNASVYGFTGRITTSDETYKIIYTAKLSTLSKITPTTTTEESNNIIVRIQKGSYSQGGTGSYIESGSIKYFSQDRISVQPGTTITIINDDTVTHNIISGKEKNDRYITFIPDGRISTGEIAVGGSAKITFDNAGFYRLYDPDYQWMKIVAYVFPTNDNIILGKGQNLGN
ncbi:MAG: cupredoxin domain-containing protein [Candidatus Nitrosopumilus sp. bin_7KS]